MTMRVHPITKMFIAYHCDRTMETPSQCKIPPGLMRQLLCAGTYLATIDCHKMRDGCQSWAQALEQFFLNTRHVVAAVTFCFLLLLLQNESCHERYRRCRHGFHIDRNRKILVFAIVWLLFVTLGQPVLYFPLCRLLYGLFQLIQSGM